jgi:cytochrome P450
MLQSLPSLQSLSSMRQQYDWLHKMRRDHPVWLDEASGAWHVFRYEDVNRVVTDSAQFSSKRRINPGGRQAPSIIAMDPPEHRQYRNLVSPFFTPKALSRLSERIAAIVQDLLDEVRSTGKIDVIEALAYPLPVTVIAEMLGVPAADRPQFRRWADALLNLQLSDAEIMQSQGEARFRNMQPTVDEMAQYFKQKLEEHRRQPQNDLISELLAAEVEGARLTEEEILSFSQLLLLAGHVTTTNLLGLSILCLDAHPEAVEQLRRQPELMPSAIEEVLRYLSIVWRLFRTTTTEVTMSGVHIPANATIFAWIASANYDSAVFPDPERFDITRSPNKHLSFGHGIHFCVGAPLARLEASIALPMILEQLPHLRCDPNDPCELFESGFLLGTKRLPVMFEPAISK